MFKQSLYIVSLILIFISCIDPYQIDLEEGAQLLTVDGFITSEPGPHLIRLTRTDTYGSVFEGLIRPVRQAEVNVRDSEGRVTVLTEVEQGVYATPSDFSAVMGLSYTLQIRLLNGREYASFPERVNPVPRLDSLTYRSVRLATADRLDDKFGVQVFANFKDPSDQTNYYYWRARPGTFVLITNPELFTLPPTHPTNPRGPAPKECCKICFLTESSRGQNFASMSDESFNGLETTVPIGFIEDNGFRFKETYRATYTQMAVSQNANRFLGLINQQLSISGSVFDQPPANIRGNIISLDDPDEVIMGYFIAAGAQTKTVYIKRENLTELATPAIIPDDCRTVPGAVTGAPAGWNP